MASREQVGIDITARDIASKAINDVGGSLDGLGIKAQKSGGMLSSVFSAVGAGVGIAGGMALVTTATTVATDAIGGAIRAASDLNEQGSKVNVVFGSSAGAVQKFAATAASSMGVSTRAALQATGTFGNMLTAMGLGAPRAAEMSTRMVALAGDLASFNNIPVADALEKIRAGLAGETEPLRALGVNLSDVTLRQKALDMGLTVGAGVLDASTRAQAAYALILEQTKTAQGDYARTADSLANSQRTLQAKMEDLSAKVGAVLVPALADAAGTAVFLVDAFNDLTGAASGASGAAGSAGSGFDVLGNAIKFAVGPAALLWEGLGNLASAHQKEAAAAAEAARITNAGTDAAWGYSMAAYNAAAASTAGADAAINTANAYASASAWARSRAGSENDLTAALLARRAVEAAAIPVLVMANGMTVTNKLSTEGYNAALAGAIAKQTQFTDSLKTTTSAAGSASSAANTLATAVKTNLTRAYDDFKTKALSALDAVHQKNLQVIADTGTAWDKDVDAKIAAAQAPVDAAQTALDRRRDAEQLASLQRAVATATDNASREQAQQALDDWMEGQRIKALQADADIQIRMLNGAKTFNTELTKDKKTAEDKSYTTKKTALEAELTLLKQSLDDQKGTWATHLTAVLKILGDNDPKFKTSGTLTGKAYSDAVIAAIKAAKTDIAAAAAAVVPPVPGAVVPPVPGGAGIAPAGLRYAADGSLVTVPVAAPYVPPQYVGNAGLKLRAAGGPVLAGEAYRVGEKGEETLLMGSQSGTIIPNAGITVGSITIQAQVFAGSEVQAAAFARQMYDALQREAARRGQSGRVA